MKKFTPILFCVLLYVILLFSAFTNKFDVDTYVCYTTKTGECYHAATCSYLRYSSRETTVYEAEKKYRKCSRCNPCISRYKTTITVTERDYLTPVLISIVVTVVGTLIYKNIKEE